MNTRLLEDSIKINKENINTNTININNLENTKADKVHTHAITDVEGLEDALDNAQIDLTPVYTAIDSLKALM